MTKLKVLVAFTAIALAVPLAVSGQKGKPPKPPVTAECTMAGDVKTDESAVTVGRDVATYGLMNQALYIHESLLPPGEAGAVGYLKAADYADGYYGPYFGLIRVLDNRIDYLFDRVEGCVQDNSSLNMCPFWVIVADGVPIYEKIGKSRVLTHIAFGESRYLLYQKTCNPAENPECLVKLYGCYDERDCPAGAGYVYATVNVLFQ
jgi:hypothetical protein